MCQKFHHAELLNNVMDRDALLLKTFLGARLSSRRNFCRVKEAWDRITDLCLVIVFLLEKTQSGSTCIISRLQKGLLKFSIRKVPIGARPMSRETLLGEKSKAGQYFLTSEHFWAKKLLSAVLAVHQHLLQ